MSKILELITEDMMSSAQRYLAFFSCDMKDGAPEYCEILTKGNQDDYIALETFVNGSQASPEVLFMLFDYFSIGKPLDEFETLRWATKEVQQRVSQNLFPENLLMLWGITEGQHWVDRSLKVVNDAEFNQKMYDRNNNLKLKNIFVHANYQYIYHSTLDVLEFLRSHP